MAMLKLFQISAPSTATAVTTTKNTLVRSVTIANSGANSTSVGDSTMTTAATGITIASGSTLTIGGNTGYPAFDLSELFVIAATGNVNVLALLF